jgi:hypothetical protein
VVAKAIDRARSKFAFIRHINESMTSVMATKLMAKATMAVVS